MESPAAEPMGAGRPSRRPRRSQPWIWQVTALSAALGLMLALAMRTTESIQTLGLAGTRHGASAADLSKFKKHNEELQAEIKRLRTDLDERRYTAKQGKNPIQPLQEQFAEYRALIGLSGMRGPGLKITLRDSPRERYPGFDPAAYMLRDVDVTGLVNELWAAGAEGVAIAGRDGNYERFVLRTTVQGAGRSIMVNGRTLSAPYTIQAIGNPKELHAALDMPEGIVQTLGLEVLKMISVEEASDLVLPAYQHSGSPRLASSQSE
jgi:uncharacterized protein YlxW (UPF0749 family)